MFMGIEPIHMFPTPLPLPWGEGKICPARPHHRRRGLLARSASPALLVERVAKAADDEATDRRRVAEPNLGLGRVDVDVHFIERNLEEQRGDRVTVAGDEVSVRAAQRADEKPVLHRPRIYEQELLV